MDFFAHIFLPRHSNNYRSKILHHNVLLFFIAVFLAGSFLTVQIKRNFPQVLGITTNITQQELLKAANEKRQQNSLAPLNLNSALSAAAEKKAEDMIVNDYWAHVSPDGTTPWVFIKSTGYEYVYAGENLAKGFTSAAEVVDAWMASPQHRENQLSSNYQDVGFAIKVGELNGEETVLIVEELGGKTLVRPQQSKGIDILTLPTAAPANTAGISIEPFFNSLLLSSNIYIILVSLFIIVLALDMIIVEKRKIVRITGHNMDHILFLITFLLAGFIIIRGAII